MINCFVWNSMSRDSIDPSQTCGLFHSIMPEAPAGSAWYLLYKVCLTINYILHQTCMSLSHCKQSQLYWKLLFFPFFEYCMILISVARRDNLHFIKLFAKSHHSKIMCKKKSNIFKELWRTNKVPVFTAFIQFS